MLKDDKVEIEHVKTLAAAKEYLATQETPAVILLDNKLPDGLGLDLLPFIRNTYPAIKIIMMSGYHPEVIMDVALENGADIFIEKPFNKQQIFDAVQKLLNPAEKEEKV